MCVPYLKYNKGCAYWIVCEWVVGVNFLVCEFASFGTHLSVPFVVAVTVSSIIYDFLLFPKLFCGEAGCTSIVHLYMCCTTVFTLCRGMRVYLATSESLLPVLYTILLDYFI